MTESVWKKQGETLSHKNACEEFAITEDELFEAMKAGRLQYRKNYAHGNPYFQLVRSEVKSLALEIRGTTGVKEQEVKHKVQEIDKEMNSLKRRLASLEKQRRVLVDGGK